MLIVISIIKAIIGYVILMIAGINLLGMVVRGIVKTPEGVEGDRILDENIFEAKGIALTIFWAIITIGFLYTLFHFWNIGVALSAILLMLGRLPDLLFEIKTGQKITKKNMPKGAIYIISTIVGWLALPLLWYSLYFLQNHAS